MNDYIPVPAKIIKVKQETSDIKTFTLKAKTKNFLPGQFCMLSLFGHGEAPFTYSSLKKKDAFDISIRKVGKLTNKLFNLKAGDKISIRGPYGNSFQLDKYKEILVVGGGCGMATMRPVIQYVLKHSNKFKKMTICYGTRTPKEFSYKDEFKDWQTKKTKLLLTVDYKDKEWNGKVGVVTDLFKDINLSKKAGIFMCGPPIMIRYAAEKLAKMGYDEKNIFASLERRMECGIGKCGHCYCNDKYVCLDGTVFSYNEMKEIGFL